MENFTQFLAENPHIHYAIPTSSDFESMRAAFVANATKMPAMIIRPHDAMEVAALISALAANELPFSVRSGGHDMFGQSQLDHGVTIDMREITHVHVDPGSQSARVGGGILTYDLIKALGQHGLVAPHPAVPGVGYIGWATHGGYSPLNTLYGMGADQIVGATVVDFQGQIRFADESMLMAIRGGGGIVGVIVEITIKVYPLVQMLAGLIIYDSQDLATAIQQYNEAYRQLKAENDLPPELGIYQCVINGPTGKSLAVIFFWASSDLEAGRTWLSKVSSLAVVAANTVLPTTLSEFTDVLKDILPNTVQGTMFALSVRELTPEVVDVIRTHAPQKPNDPAALFGIHELRSGAGTQLTHPSVFNPRTPHFLLEIAAITIQDDMEESVAWGRKFYDALKNTDRGNILPFTYLPLTQPKDVDFETIYGDHYKTLQSIKHEYDPYNLFKHTLVRP